MRSAISNSRNNSNVFYCIIIIIIITIFVNKFIPVTKLYVGTAPKREAAKNNDDPSTDRGLETSERVCLCACACTRVCVCVKFSQTSRGLLCRPAGSIKIKGRSARGLRSRWTQLTRADQYVRRSVCVRVCGDDDGGGGVTGGLGMSPS
ncbi:unnamed protein product [Aphis gossypii]|uniref:Uncharacterized protein n=1 Tax=Aphis gossypii TaxID=80765 RepID=A0A9P0NIB7_APHGO|nr:unnamed protein product [Aphis gossypii]